MRKNNLPQHLMKVPMKVSKPLVLRDVIYKREAKERTTGICLSEMSQLFICFKNYSFNEEACAKQIEAFTKCYSEVVGPNKKEVKRKVMTNEAVNKLLGRYCDKRSKIL